MNYNIYIRKQNWELFQDEDNKADLVNKLLAEHYGLRGPSERQFRVKNASELIEERNPYLDTLKYDTVRQVIYDPDTGETFRGKVENGRVISIE